MTSSNDLCNGNSPVTGEFPTQRDSNAENVSIWWRHHNLNVIASSLTTRKHVTTHQYMIPNCKIALNADRKAA